MQPTDTVTFEVSQVQRASSSLTEIPSKQAVEALLTPGMPEEHRRMVEDMANPGLSLGLSNVPSSRPVEACARYHGKLIDRVSFHPFVAAVHRAFVDHRPLRLSPDAIWLLICQAVANHVNANAEEIRPQLVSHQGRLTIDVRRDDFVKGSPENPWPEVFDEFTAKVRDHVGPAIDLFLPDFSTTGPVERAAAGVVLLDAVRSYFEFAVHSLCGIPTITLEGTTQDWEAIARRVEAFDEFGLEAWVKVLRPILRQFVRASRGEVDGAFWKSLYKLNNQSGGPVITGWITAFFPYLKERGTGRACLRIEGFFTDEDRRVEEMLYPVEQERPGFAHGPTVDSLPGGLSSVPFRWEYRDRTFTMEFLGGFVGVAQDSGTLALWPEIGWAVREAESAK